MLAKDLERRRQLPDESLAGMEEKELPRCRFAGGRGVLEKERNGTELPKQNVRTR